MRRTPVLFLASLAVVAALPQAAGADPSPVWYRPPVEGEPVDRFRPPATPYGAGNRGIDYGVPEGATVRAAAAGEVVFAGRIGGSSHVVVLHADGIRTSYSFLARTAVRRGDRVSGGQPVGIAGGPVHFGARAGDIYLDPEALFAGSPTVHLVPDGDTGPASVAEERRSLVASLGGAARAALRAGAAQVGRVRDAAGALVERGRAVVHHARSLARTPLTAGTALVRAVAAWRAQRGRCTPARVAPPSPSGRRAVVLVGGLGSTSARGGAAVDDVDAVGLGYAPDDVVRFSYRGGATGDHAYDGADTMVDIRVSARRLRALLERIRRERPGVPVDLIAHSQGGLVVRAMLAYERSRLDPRLPPLGAVVTLGTPHAGTDLATAAVSLGPVTGGVLSLVPGAPNPRARSVRQMAETSGFIADLQRRPLPPDVRFTSIAARGDVVVPALRSRVDGATNVVVSVDGLARDHDALPGAPAARREVALALAGLPPTCEDLGDAVLDALVPVGVGAAEDAVGAAVSRLP